MSATPIKNYWISSNQKPKNDENNGARFTFSKYDNVINFDKNNDISDKIKKQIYNSRESTDILKVLDMKSKGGKEYELDNYRNKVDSVE